MAGKNEIRYRVAVEGDEDAKRRLKAVDDAANKVRPERTFSSGGGGGGGSGGGGGFLGSARAALGPFAERAGLSGLLNNLGGGFGGLGAGGGLLSRIGGFLKTPGGAFTAIAGAVAGIAAHLAGVREEIEKQQTRLEGFGANKNASKELEESANRLGINPAALASGREQFEKFNRQQRVANRSVAYAPGLDEATLAKIEEREATLPRVFAGGKLVSGPVATGKAFDRAVETLINSSKVDKTKTDDAAAAVRDFFASTYRQHDLGTDLLTGQRKSSVGVTSEAVDALQKASPEMAARLAKALGQPNADALNAVLDRRVNGLLDLPGPNAAITALGQPQQYDAAAAAAAKARGISDAGEGLLAGVGRAERRAAGFGDGTGSIGTTAIDAVTAGIDKASDPKFWRDSFLPENRAEFRARPELFAPVQPPLVPQQPPQVPAAQPAPASPGLSELFSSLFATLQSKIESPAQPDAKVAPPPAGTDTQSAASALGSAATSATTLGSAANGAATSVGSLGSAAGGAIEGLRELAAAVSSALASLAESKTDQQPGQLRPPEPAPERRRGFALGGAANFAGGGKIEPGRNSPPQYSVLL